ncbi:alpha-mannosidase [Enterococcus faecium]|nr:alpha-mannosidase [Enterococcus faecium]
MFGCSYYLIQDSFFMTSNSRCSSKKSLFTEKRWMFFFKGV